MADKYMQLVLTPSVQQAQDKYFGKHQVVENAPETDALRPDETGFIASRDSFYMATVSETGWPYQGLGSIDDKEVRAIPTLESTQQLQINHHQLRK